MTTPHPDNPHLVNPSCEPFRDELEAYALGALDDAGRFRMETHLDACGPCRASLADIQDVTNYLPFLSTPSTPSPSVKASLMEQIAADINGDTPRAYPNPWAASQTGPEQEQAPSGSSNWQRWIAPALVGPLVIALIVLGAWTNSLQQEVEDLRSRGQIGQLVDQNAQQGFDIQLYDFKPACPNCENQQASGQLGGNPNSNVGVVVVWNLDPNEKHQVWCVNKQGEKQLVSDLEVEHGGSVFQTVAFPQELGGYQKIYVARHDGTTDPDTELLVAMTEEDDTDEDPGTPQSN